MAPTPRRRGNSINSPRRGFPTRISSISTTTKACCHRLSDKEKEDLVNGVPNILVRQGHHMQDLTDLLEDMAPSETMENNTERQKNAITAFKKLYSSLPEKVRRMRTGGKGCKKIAELVQEFYPILDDVFFLGAVHQSVPIRVKEDFKNDDNDFAYFDIGGDNYSNPHIVIYRMRDTPPFDDDYLRWYLGSLVHEMIHAFFSLHQCYGSHYKPTKCRKKNERLEGAEEDYHGPAFTCVETALHLSAGKVLGMDLMVKGDEGWVNRRVPPYLG